jgi:hypothetical protein
MMVSKSKYPPPPFYLVYFRFVQGFFMGLNMDLGIKEHPENHAHSLHQECLMGQYVKFPFFRYTNSLDKPP